MQEKRRKEIRKTAYLFREKCKVDRYGIMDLFRECNRTGYKLIRYPLGEGKDLGFTVKRDRDIIIFTNSSVRLSREIFTLAHEIGHAMLHMEDTSSFVDDEITLANNSADNMEIEANYFAAVLLMPDDEVNRFKDLELAGLDSTDLAATDIAKMMSEFNVSFDMVLNRLENLGIIDIAQKTRLFNERNEKRVTNLLRSVGGNARLNRASEDIDIPIEYLEYVIYNYNHNAIPKETLEKALNCYHLSMDDIIDRIAPVEEADDNLDDLIGGLED